MENKPLSFYLSFMNTISARFAGTPSAFVRQIQATTSRLAALEAQADSIRNEMDQLNANLLRDKAMIIELYQSGALALVPENEYQIFVALIDTLRTAVGRFGSTPESISNPAPEEVVSISDRLQSFLADIESADAECRGSMLTPSDYFSPDALVEFVNDFFHGKNIHKHEPVKESAEKLFY